jgi:hypothetical protein
MVVKRFEVILCRKSHYPKKKEIEAVEARVKFRGLRMWPTDEILKMCKASYPQLGLNRVIGFTTTPKGKDIYLIEGTNGTLILKDAG